ncbi:MAG TPA: pyruvate:ferredoxin (flavodoxin) oxidoreductase [Candidatus Eisenbacteria bacterium]|nr:pyruvate:ferredoxin (flavodoxin) oxidoreductase [Candidatus Eisenbacteria bacterium]
MAQRAITVDGAEAAASVAYRLSEVIALYPITPSTSMGEWCDAWSSKHRPNFWGSVPLIQQMQSEAGAAGAVHGALQTGAVATTFTASQGLLLMIPNLYKIAGELTPAVIHVATRAIATHALSIFGDHSDIMAARGTGWAILSSASVQEAADFALIAYASTFKSRIPFLNALDGFRTSHEIQKIVPISDEEIRLMIDENLVRAFRSRGLSPDRPTLRGTAQNPDVFFQSREAANPYYAACPDVVRAAMERFFRLTGRHYRLFDYAGAPDAERVLVVMGSACQTAQETAERLASAGEKVGVVKVRLFRPFSTRAFLESLPRSVKAIAVLDRCKEPGAEGEPLYKDVATAVGTRTAPGPAPAVIGGRYGLGSKEFTPGMAKAAFDELRRVFPRNPFTLGIRDDVGNTSLEEDFGFSLEDPGTTRAIFYGLGSDGTVGANKNTIKIIGEETAHHAQGYFVYDSKKSGGVTVSHLRFGPRPIRSPYLIRRANFVGVHQFFFLERYPTLEHAEDGAVVLLNCPYPAGEAWDRLPAGFRQEALKKHVRLYAIDAYRLARAAGLGGRINTLMQTAFFALSGVMPVEQAVECVKVAIRKTYAKHGEEIVSRNLAAVDSALSGLAEVPLQAAAVLALPSDRRPEAEPVPPFVRGVTLEIAAGRGESLPVSAMPADGAFPTGTSRFEKRSIASDVPLWSADSCIQCGKCVMACPHAALRAKVYPPALLESAPDGFRSSPAKWREYPDHRYTLQLAADDCTGCGVCVDVCPARDKADRDQKAIALRPKEGLLELERLNWDFFLSLPDLPKGSAACDGAKNLQLSRPLFEFSGACSGCGETPYLKLLSQCFGDRSLIANATGCSSIYGGNLPATPWCAGADGRGPAWANSLFEDNAEFGLGFRLALDQRARYAAKLLAAMKHRFGDGLAEAVLSADQSDERGIQKQRERVAELLRRLKEERGRPARELENVADALVQKSVWVVGGDGWACDIGYGGLDHALASGRDFNVLVLDTEVYSNTGGQASKSTSLGAVAKFASAGKRAPKKDLGRIFMSYESVYVAQVSLGANESQTALAFREAESYAGPSLVLAYSPCIEHGFDMSKTMRQEKMAVESGYWPLYRFDPRRAERGLNPFQLDSRKPSLPLKDYLYSENRYRSLTDKDPMAAAELLAEAQSRVENRRRHLEALAAPWPEEGRGLPDRVPTRTTEERSWT